MSREQADSHYEDPVASHDALKRLREQPDGPRPDREPRTALQALPLGKLTWPDFEKLAYRLAELDGAPPEYVSPYGVSGDEQQGIDIYSRLSDGAGYVVYQCKRYSRLYPHDLKDAVDEFLKHKWSRPGNRFAGRFVFCTSHSVARRSIADAIETQADRLRERDPPVVFDAWGQERLSKDLKAHPDLVEDFFGPAFVELFIPGVSGHADAIVELSAQVAELTDALQALTLQQQTVIVSTLSWAPTYLKQVLNSLADDDPPAYAALRDVVGEPPDIEVVLANIAAPAMLLRSGPAGTWQALALIAEEKGEWAAGSQAWERAAKRAVEEYSAAGDYLSAAASSHIGGDTDRQSAMLEAARERYPQHPRLLLDQVRELEPQEQLDLLDGVELRHPIDVALVEAQRALSCLLLPDLDRAAEHVKRSEEALPDSVAVEMVKLNLVVQRARLNQVDGRDQRAEILRTAYRHALAIRDGLHKQRRWTEAAPVLMLAVDILGLQGEFEAAQELVSQARPEEVADPESAEVLGQAALRNLAPRVALELTKDAPETDGIRVLRATAVLDDVRSSRPARTAARAQLNAVIADGGQYAIEASFARLVDAMAHGDWSKEAEARLSAEGHERPALVLRAFYLGERHADWEQAFALFDGIDDRRWALPARLRVAARWGKHSVLKAAADDMMAAAPGQGLKLECGRAYGKVREYDRAREVLNDVAEDESAPAAARAEAYRLLVVTAGAYQNDWEAADRFHQKWVQVRPGDTRASALAVTIANRLPHRPK